MRAPFSIKAVMGQVAWHLLSFAGVHRVWRWLNRRRVLIVMYHGVAPDGVEHYNWSQLPESKFRRQLEYLKRRYRVVPLSEIAEAIGSGHELPPYTAAITFDDGFANNATVAARHLRDLGLPATIFLVTDYVGEDQLLWPDELYLLLMQAEPQTIELAEFGLETLRIDANSCRWTLYVGLLERLKAIPASAKDEVLARLRERAGRIDDTQEAKGMRLMTWDQVKTLNDDGLITFGAHTVTHQILTRLRPDEAAHEVVESCRVVRERTGIEPVAFAFPNGGRRDFSNFLQRLLRIEGASCALTTVEGLNGPDEHVYALKRIAVGANTTMARFALKCSGFVPMLQSFAERLSGGHDHERWPGANESPRVVPSEPEPLATADSAR